LGNVPVFVSILSEVPQHRRIKILMRECIIALFVLLFFLFFGRQFLKLLNVSGPALSIAGGLVLFLIAIKMIFPSNTMFGESDHIGGEPFVVPLAVPMIAGPSAITVIMLLAIQQENNISVMAGAIGLSWLCASIILVSSFQLSKIFGPKIMTAVTRLMGMILTAISVEMFLKGVSTYLKG
jgi:MarC family membrane protein